MTPPPELLTPGVQSAKLLTPRAERALLSMHPFSKYALGIAAGKRPKKKPVLTFWQKAVANTEKPNARERRASNVAMKKILCLIALAALCGCATERRDDPMAADRDTNGVVISYPPPPGQSGPNDPLTGNDWNFGPR